MDAETQPTPAFARFPRIVVAAIMCVPLVWLALFWSLVLRARVVVGEWPHPRSGNLFLGTDVDTSIDPKEFGWHHDAIWMGVPLTIWSVIAGLCALVLGVFWARARVSREMRTAFVCASVLCLVTVMFDVGHFWDWYLD